MHARALNQYKRVYVESASPIRILDELLCRCVRDLEQASSFTTQKNILKKRELVDHALAIVTELIAALDYTTSPELCKNLERLYVYARERIVQSSAEMTTRGFEEAASILSTLRDSFRGLPA
jgi:flagellar biosynthetic protein FliS